MDKVLAAYIGFIITEMRKALEGALKFAEQPDYCYVCDVKLTNPNVAAQHYPSKRHKEKLQATQKKAFEKFDINASAASKKVSTSAKATEKIRLHCDICDIKLDVNSVNQHYEEDDHKKKEAAYCSVCHILTMSQEQLWQHMQGSKHRNKLEELGLPALDDPYSPFDQALPLDLKKIMLVNICQVCNAKFPTMKHALSHYKSQKHKASVQHWFKENRRTKKLSENTNAEAVPTKVDDYYCFACKMSVSIKSGMDNHRLSFPHTELVKLKSDMVSKGITEEYWMLQDKSVLCTLCDVQILVADEHFNCSSHRLKFYNWLRKVSNNKIPAEIDTDFYYCKICDKVLDGTSESGRHYLFPPHQKKSLLYCKTCDVRNSTPEMLEIHCTTTLHIENTKKSNSFLRENEVKKEAARIPMPSWCQNDAETQNPRKSDDIEDHKPVKSLKTNLDNTNSKLTTSSEIINVNLSENNTALKEQVFQEIEKLVQTLYYSKAVPYDVALKFLKRVNKEVENLKKNDKKERQEEGAGYFESSNGPSEKNYFEDHNIEDISRISNEKYVSVEEDSSFKGDTILTRESPSVDDLIDFSDNFSDPAVKEVDNNLEKIKSNDHLMDFVDNYCNGTEDSSEMFNNKVLTFDKEQENDSKDRNIRIDNLTQKETSFQLEKACNLESMLEEIILLKNQVEEKYPGEVNVEKDVLTEMERLIVLVNSGDIPLDQTLMCLQDFNKELDLQNFNALDSDGGNVELEDDGDPNKTKEAKPDVKYRYSKEELLSLRTEKTFTDRLDLKLRLILNKNRMWNKLCNDLDLD